MADRQGRLHDDDEDYDEEADEDFNPETAAQDDNVSSSEDEAVGPASSSAVRKRKHGSADVVDAELDSGDEVTIRQRQKRRKKGVVSDDEDGEGGFVKTRSQRRHQQLERGPLATTKGATVDVDALWAKLSSVPVGRPLEPIQAPTNLPKQQDKLEEYITINRTTKFAGEVMTESRRVLKSSEEARLYLEELEVEKKRKEAQTQEHNNSIREIPETVGKYTLRRPSRRPSRFDPNPLGEVRALPPHLQLKWPRNKQQLVPQNENTAAETSQSLMQPPKLPAATKLNVVQKSRHDWAGYVDKAGIAEELDKHGKSKAGYLDRTEFLNRTENRREADLRAARTKLS